MSARYSLIKENIVQLQGCTASRIPSRCLFFMPEFSSINIIEHQFHVNNDKGESVIGYDMIIDHDLVVQLDLPADFKRQILQQDGVTVTMK